MQLNSLLQTGIWVQNIVHSFLPPTDCNSFCSPLKIHSCYLVQAPNTDVYYRKEIKTKIKQQLLFMSI